MSETKPFVFIAMPTASAFVKAGTVVSLVDTIFRLQATGYGMHFQNHDGSLVTHARNLLVSTALAHTPFSHFLFIDHDMIFRGNLIVELLKADKDIVGTSYTHRGLPIDALNDRIKERLKDGVTAEDFDLRKEMAMVSNYSVYQRAGQTIWVNGPYAEVPGVAAGTMLIKRTVFEAMIEKGVVEKRDDGKAYGISGPLWGFFDPVRNPDSPDDNLGEDFSFCHRWTHGCEGKVHCHIDADVKHVGDFGYFGHYRAKLGV